MFQCLLVIFSPKFCQPQISQYLLLKKRIFIPELYSSTTKLSNLIAARSEEDLPYYRSTITNVGKLMFSRDASSQSCTITCIVVHRIFAHCCSFFSLHQMTPLHVAAESARIRIVKYFVENKAAFEWWLLKPWHSIVLWFFNVSVQYWL